MQAQCRQAGGGDGLAVALVLFVGCAELDALGKFGEFGAQDIAGLAMMTAAPAAGDAAEAERTRMS